MGIAGQSAAIHQNKLYVLGGSNFPEGMPWAGGQKKYFDQLWVYQLDNEIKSIPQTVSLSYPQSIAYATAVLHNHQWIIVGGETPAGRIASVNAMDFSSSVDLHWKALPALPIALSNAHGFVASEKLHIVGGETGNITAASHFVLDLRNLSKGWTSLPDLPYPVSHAVLIKDQKNNRVLLVGGRTKINNQPSLFYRSVLSYDPVSNKWKEAEPIPYPLAAGTGIALKDGSLFIFGGDKGTVFHQVEQCLLEASRSKDPAVIATWDEKRKMLQSGHPGFSREILEWNEKERKWEPQGNLPFPTPVTTQAVCDEQYLILPAGEVRAGVSTPNFYIKKIKSS
jgi:N-acetylneuraminic acid mutarotase